MGIVDADGVKVLLGEEELLLDGVFDLSAYTQLVVDGEDARHFVMAVGGCGREEGAKLGLLGRVGILEGLQVEVGLFVVADVLSGLFAKGGSVAVGIEKVVLELEGEAEMDAELVEMVDVGSGSVGV